MHNNLFSNLTAPRNLKPGIAATVWLAPLKWFTQVARPVPPFTLPGQSVLITTSHTFKPGKGFLQFDLAPQKNKLEAKTVGDLGGNWLETTVEIFVPGSYTQAHAALANLLNKPLIVLVKDCNCPDEWFYNIGDSCLSAWLTGDFTTSTAKDGAKGFTIKLQTNADALYYYSSEITPFAPKMVLNGQDLELNGFEIMLNF